MSTPAAMFLKHVAQVVAERSAQYGDAATNMSAIAARWSATLGREVTPAQVVLCLLDLKLARLAHDPTSVLDACDREQRMSAGKRPTLLVYRVICTDQEAMQWPEEDIGNLRVALNALVRLFRL